MMSVCKCATSGLMCRDLKGKHEEEWGGQYQW